KTTSPAERNEGHFGRAAEQLGMEQPVLSRSIHRLEDVVGVRLFQRRPGQLTTTNTGTIFRSEARRITAHAGLSDRILRRSIDPMESLRVGFTPTAMYQAVPKVLRLLGRRYPSLNLLVEQTHSRLQLEHLRDGRLDVGFVNRETIDSGE